MSPSTPKDGTEAPTGTAAETAEPSSTEATAAGEEQRSSGTLESLGNVAIHWIGWLPPSVPRAALLFVHGLAEHSGRYHWPMDYFRTLGFACYALDLRGHGRSGGKPVHVDHFDDYDADVGALVRSVRDRHPGLPIYLVGHSMGGVITLRYALRHSEEVEGSIVSSPGLDAHPESAPPGWLKLVGLVVSKIMPGALFPSGLDPSSICRDPAVVKAYIEDPAVTNKVSARWFTAFLAAQKELFEKAGNLRLPLLLMQSEGDRLVDPEATGRWARAAPRDLVSYYTWPDFYHEMFNEPDRHEVYELMEKWLGDRLSEGRGSPGQ